MSKKRRNYSDEFKIEVVKLVTEQGLSIAEAARDLGVNGVVLARWKRTHEQGLLGDTVKQREADELRQLKKENRRLRMERDILKKGGIPQRWPPDFGQSVKVDIQII